MVMLDQAVFASTRTAWSDGYHVAARSHGVDPQDCRALARWGPSHDALVAGASRSVNFHALPSGKLCLSVTVASGIERSHRGGSGCHTHCLIFPSEALAAVEYHPWPLFAAAERAGIFRVREPLSELLPCVELPVRAGTDFAHENVPGDLLAALAAGPCAVVGADDHEDTVSAIVSKLPPPERLQCSFTTALRYSPQRPFRLMCLPDQLRLCRRVTRGGVRVFELARCA
jgi:hypothetical protein